MIKILHHPLLADYSTIGLGGEALALMQVSQLEDLTKLSEEIQSLGASVRFLGGASNIIAKDGKLPFTLVQMAIEENLNPKSICPEPACIESVCPELVAIEEISMSGQNLFALKKDVPIFRVQVGAGNSLPGLLNFCKVQELQGLEGLVGVPGKLGGAIFMNAGAFGCEMAHVLESVIIYTELYGVETFTRDKIDMTYRHFSIKNRTNFAICRASLLFQKGANIPERMKENLMLKKERQPIQARTAGCIFKNPKHELDLPKTAGELLDKAGLKGKQLGGMRFSNIHANFLENMTSGTSSEALELIEIAKQSIKKQFSIHLEEEVCIWA